MDVIDRARFDVGPCSHVLLFIGIILLRLGTSPGGRSCVRAVRLFFGLRSNQVDRPRSEIADECFDQLLVSVEPFERDLAASFDLVDT